MGSSELPGFSVKDTVKIMPMLHCCDFACSIVMAAQTLLKGHLNQQLEFNNHLLSKQILTRFQEFFEKEKEISGHSFQDISYCSPLKIEGGKIWNSGLKYNNDFESSKHEVFKFSIAVNLKGYCSYFVRSLVYGTSNIDEETLHFIKLVYEKLLDDLRDGIELCKVYESVHSFAKKENPNLATHLQKELGFKLGPNSKNKSVAINSNTKTIAQKGMFFGINLNLVDFEQKGVKYSLYIGDTVLVRKGQSAMILTDISETESEISHQLTGNEI